MLKLIRNEMTKIIFKRKILLIMIILLIEIMAFAYAQSNRYHRIVSSYTKSSSGNYNWRPLIKEQITDINNKLSYKNVKESDKRIMNIQLKQYDYYLEKNINPAFLSASKFTTNLMSQTIMMLLPLLIIILAADSVSGEFSSKTIKVLLTRAVPRWKVLLSKYISLIIMSAFVVFLSALISMIVSGITFHDLGFMEPVISGYKMINGEADASNVVMIYEWQYLILVCSLSFFVSMVIASISFMVSILVKSTAASIGIMMATLIGGSLLKVFLEDWPFSKYFFAVNLDLPQYLIGQFKGVSGMNMIFSLGVLALWVLGALIVSFAVFSKKDVLV